MKVVVILFTTLLAAKASAFLSPSHHRSGWVSVVTNAIAGDIDAMAEQRLDDIAKRLKLQVYDDTTGVYGFESKDPLYGIETVHTDIEMDVHGHLGLTLVSEQRRGRILSQSLRALLLTNHSSRLLVLYFNRPKSRTPISITVVLSWFPR